MKISRIIVLSALALLTACQGGDNKVGADGYSFGEKEFDLNQVSIKVTTYSDRKQLQAAAAERIEGDTSEIMAFTTYNKDFPGVCRLHIMDPSVVYEPEFVGHEFYHCLYGQFHTDNDSRG